MNKTKIEWCDFTWNPVTGCFGPGGTPEKPNRCPWCYAHRLARGRLKNLYLSNRNAPFYDRIPAEDKGRLADDPFIPRFWFERLHEPEARKKPAKIFVSDMGDLFHDYVPGIWIEAVWLTMKRASQHTFQLLTKNPARYLELEAWNWPVNCWLGTTVTNQEDWIERWSKLQRVKASVRYVSFEPLLGPIRLHITWAPDIRKTIWPDWAIIGALTGRGGAPDETSEWVEDLVMKLDGLHIPIFMKDNLRPYVNMPLRREWPKKRWRR